jgi:hypothetical protein
MDSFLETTALIDLTFKDKATRNKVIALCVGDKITSRYVIFELSRGYLRNLILIYNKAIAFSKFSDLFGYLNRIRRKAHLAGTITEAFQKFFAEGLQSGDIEKESPFSVDERTIIAYRGWLRKQIRYNWKRIAREPAKVINPTGCIPEIPDPKLDENNLFTHDLPRTCGMPTACGIRVYTERHQADFVKVRAMLLLISDPDIETQNRIRSLKELYRKRGPFHKTECYRSGDALIAHECPSTARVVSKNSKHIEPICQTLNKGGIFYK